MLHLTHRDLACWLQWTSALCLVTVLLAPNVAVYGQNVNNGGQNNANGNPASTTVKTTTIRTVPPTKRDMKPTTLGPLIKTTSRAKPIFDKTDPPSTKNPSKVLTDRPGGRVTERPGPYPDGAPRLNFSHFLQVLLPLLTLWCIAFVR